MSSLRLLVCAFAGALLLSARPARALGAEAGLGADYLFDDEAGDFMGFIALDTSLVPRLTLGARFGMVLESDPSRFGIPLDARLRLRIRRLYLEGLAGGWLFFKGDDNFRFHAAGGAGLTIARAVRMGLEVGYLDPSAMVGLRLAFGF